MSNAPQDERVVLIRAARQRLESLRRSGLDRMPQPVTVAARRRHAAGETESSAVAVSPPAAESVPVPPAVPAVAAAAPTVSLFGTTGFDIPQVSPAERPAQLATLAQEVAGCTRCALLAETRTQTVFGTGPGTARLMFVGEAPGADEDRLGQPFVGRAGMLLTDMITKGMGLRREEVYIANVLKCRPPENRTPDPVEIAHCLPFLERQIAIVRPEFLCLLGRVAASALLDTVVPLSRLRGRWHSYRGIPTIVTYHPSYLLRSPHEKKKAWEDLQLLMQAMGLKVPPRKQG